MRVSIEADLDVYHDDTAKDIHDLMDRLTIDMRQSRRLSSWSIQYDVTPG